MRVLQIKLENEFSTITSFSDTWNKSDQIWKARASLVPFAQSKQLEKHSYLVIEYAKVLIKREERFCKTAVGWVMRDVFKFKPELVQSFLTEYEDFVTPEVKRNALKYKTKKGPINRAFFI